MGHAITHTRRDRVAYIALIGSGDGNRFTRDMAVELIEACEDAEDADTTAVVIRGSRGSFCEGMAPGLSPEDLLGRDNPVEAVARLTRPVIAVVEGHAGGLGAELALAADFRCLATTASFSFPDVTAGRLPTFGATQRLPRLIGRARALEILLLGREVSAAEAVEIGLATRVTPTEDLPAAVAALADTLARHGPLALALTKEAVLRAGDLSLAEGMRLEEDLYALLQTTEDRREGVRSFLEKRVPRFRGD
jgi:enoyl-CoA hydratase/carnithine racemase